ncbi:eukaryotic translation initiation factor 2-alpha kinase 3-like [Liolophura sinensis]|uniref:eukaryotic translation initiation factor 2-alpha kinase 3-like n=1 Tax=Liolophura sinensis TaxID=3198878 RepID=UPI003158EE7A
MGRRKNKWSARLWSVIASVATLFIAKSGVSSTATTTSAENVKTPCKIPQDYSNLMLVSTLDGKMSALDLNQKGSMAWSINTGSQPLLSSSISKLGIMRNGERTRLIPSLDGGLYQYNGESIEAVPFTAETLLSSSFKLSENTVVVGGKELCTYGLEKQTGQTRYRCTVQGCTLVGNKEVSEEEDILMITRNTHTVRAVDSRTGAERWNFSVGQHEVHLFEGVKKVIQTDTSEEEDDDGISIVTCQHSGEEDPPVQQTEFEGVLKVIVPRGMVVAVSKTDSEQVLWKREFPSPIANAWTVSKGKLEPVNLFSEQIIPALTGSAESETVNLPPEPLLYVGIHQDQMYVQPSVKMKDMVSEASAGSYPGRNGNSDTNSGVAVRVPRVSWKPYLATAPSRTPALRVGFERASLPLLGEEDSVIGESDSSAMSVWQDMYPYDGGCYLYPDFTPVLPLEGAEDAGLHNNGSVMDEGMDTISVTLWNWWREVVAITVVTAVVVHLLTYKYSQRGLTHQVSVSDSQGTDKSSESKSVDDQSAKMKELEDKSTEYTSRYYTDFEHVRCLGKGGFGIVFEAMNKMDECPYAVKRISLTNSDTAKEKVMREVKALAKLDHGGIVRYYQAWLESPPIGWQEKRDRAMEDSECLTPTPCNSGNDLHTDVFTPPYVNPFSSCSPSHRVDISSDVSTTRESENDSEGFVPKVNFSDDDESGSFSLGIPTPVRHTLWSHDDSIEVVFSNSTPGDTGDSDMGAGDGMKLFHHQEDTNDTCSIVFEDSGCGDGHHGIDKGSSLFKNCTNSDQKLSSAVVSSQSEDLRNSNRNKSKHFGAPRLYLFIQMQLCQRETLKDWLMANTLNRDRHMLLDIFDQIVTAVQYVHDCGLMHRDLKPSNIFFSTDGVVKVGDFGLVTALSEQEDSSEQRLTRQKSGDNHTAQVGTHIYMSPEQRAGKSYDQKVDIYSLGVILFELLFPFATQMERIRTLQDVTQHKSPERFKREMPKEHDFVVWLLDHDPDKRPTAKDILESSLLEDFAVRHNFPKRLRTRTISCESNGSL